MTTRRPFPHDMAIAGWRASIPEELWSVPAWLMWVRRPKPGKPGKFDKIPHYVDGRQRCGTNGSRDDRAQLVEFGDALVAYRCGRFDGIGVALLPDVPVWALDLDDCITDGHLSGLAQRAVQTGTYCERSPSGHGIRALFAGKIGLDKKNHTAGVEVFDRRGFVTITGDRIAREILADESLLLCPPPLLSELLAIVHAGPKSTRVAPLTDAPPENPALARAVKLPLRIWQRLANPYPSGCDRSAVAYSIALQLSHRGVTAEQALELMSAPEILAPALERRSGDIASAREWMHRYVVLPAFESGGSRGG